MICKSYAGNDGKIVTVLDYAGPPGFEGCDLLGRSGSRWFVDTTLRTNVGTYINHLGEGQLIRIDGTPEEETNKSLQSNAQEYLT